MNSSISYLGGEARQLRMAAAQETVRQFEGDSEVVNERYDQKFYRSRRLTLLASLPSPTLNIVATATADAALVFESQPEILSVQAVRARELHLDLDPLLPLPTRENCETLTDFDEYPASEWQAGDPAVFPRDHRESPVPSVPRARDQEILGGRETRSPTAPGYRPFESVAALGGRGIAVPVKPPPSKTGGKRTASEILDEGSEQLDSEVDDQVIDLEAAALPEDGRPTKRAKRSNTAGLQAPAVDQAPAATKGVARRLPKKANAGAVKKAPAKKAKKPKKAAARKAPKVSIKKETANFSNIRVRWPATVTGSRLPKSIKEAFEAAAERTEILYKAHALQTGEPRQPNQHLDFLPETHHAQNFQPDELPDVLDDPDDDTGPIRCVCDEGDVASKPDWIRCDTVGCRVWQHVECVGSAAAATPELREAKWYECHVCSPWAHRRSLQALRKERPDPIGDAIREGAVDESEGEEGGEDGHDDDDYDE
ncbi:hypothetical protein SMMN14_03751 [Sphaerulina musiva]